MALMVPPANEKKRVKVYELKNNDWFDRGTGFCTGRIINVSNLKTRDTAGRDHSVWTCRAIRGTHEADLGVG